MDDLIDSLNAIQDTSYTITKYSYVNGKLVSEKTTTNILPIAFAENQTYKRKSPYQFIIETQYIYDPKGNLIERTIILDGEIIDQRKFIIEYYEKLH
jgi:hypothetical protein